jgi:hypothetical protein
MGAEQEAWQQQNLQHGEDQQDFQRKVKRRACFQKCGT